MCRADQVHLTPVVSVRSKPKGEPMARHSCPTRTPALEPSCSGFSTSLAAGTFSTARSAAAAAAAAAAAGSLQAGSTACCDQQSAVAVTCQAFVHQKSTFHIVHVACWQQLLFHRCSICCVNTDPCDISVSAAAAPATALSCTTTHRVPCRLPPALHHTSAAPRQAAAASPGPRACLWPGWGQSSPQHWQAHQTLQALTARQDMRSPIRWTSLLLCDDMGC
jgi:hypothetical protein